MSDEKMDTLVAVIRKAYDAKRVGHANYRSLVAREHFSREEQEKGWADNERNARAFDDACRALGLYLCCDDKRAEREGRVFRTWKVVEADNYEAPIEWESSDGICLRFIGGDQFKAYAPSGSRMIDCDHFDSAAEAKAKAGEVFDADPARWAR